MAERLPGWARGLLRAACLAWPRAERATFGADMRAVACRTLAERGPVSVREVVLEAATIAAAGASLRTERMTTATTRWTMGWSGDVRVAFRTLFRNPGFTFVATATLAVGIGANAAVFSLASSVLLTPPPYAQPEDLVLIWNTLPGSGDRLAVAGPDAAILQERTSLLEQVGFMMRGVDGAIEASAGDGAEHVRLSAVSPNFFEVLGVEAARGRRFDGRAVVAGTVDQSVLISHGLWVRVFGSDPGVVGRDVLVNGMAVEVAGVLPADFVLTLPEESGVSGDVDLWLPLTVPLSDLHRSDANVIDRDSDNTGVVVGRLAEGATLSSAAGEVARIGEDLRVEIPSYGIAGLGLEARPLQADAVAHARPPLFALVAGVGVVLLVACLNLSTLLLARGFARRREFAVRTALGGGRRHLVRHLLIEHSILVGIGLAGALILANAVLPLLAATLPAELTPRGGVSLDALTALFATGLAGLVVLAFGLLPAADATRREARGDLGPSMSGSAAPRSRARAILVGGQIALSVVLVLGAGLMVRTVRALESERPGFDTADALTFRVSLRVPTRYRSPAYRAEFMDRIASEVAEAPGVRAVGLVGVLPLGGDRWSQPYGLPGQSEDEWHENRADFQMISSGYFEAIGARLIEGRTFTAREDLEEDERVVVVDEKLARRIAPDGSALNRVIGIPLDGRAVTARVVGVVEHIRHERLDRDGREAVYVPYRQEASRDVTFIVRGVADAGVLADAVTRSVHALDPQVPVYDVHTLEEYVRRAVAPRRFVLSLLLGFAALTLLCAALGLYGMMAFDVRRRTREIGIRVAVGATRADVLSVVLRRVAVVSVLGLAAGLALGGVVAPALRSQLFGVGVLDPPTWVGTTALVGAAALLAGIVPAWRATALDSTTALTAD